MADGSRLDNNVPSFELVEAKVTNPKLYPKFDNKGAPKYITAKPGEIKPEFQTRLIDAEIASNTPILCYLNEDGDLVPETRRPPHADESDYIGRTQGNSQRALARIEKELLQGNAAATGVLARAHDGLSLSQAYHPRPRLGVTASSVVLTAHANKDDVYGKAFVPARTPMPQDDIGYMRVSFAQKLGTQITLRPLIAGENPKDPNGSITPASINKEATDFQQKNTDAMTVMFFDPKSNKWTGQTLPFGELPDNLWNISHHYADGIFTGIVVYQIDGKVHVFRLDKHLKRAERNAKKINIKADTELLYAVSKSQLLADKRWIPDVKVNVGNPSAEDEGEQNGLGNRYYLRDFINANGQGPGIGGPDAMLGSIGAVVGPYMPKGLKALKVILRGPRPVSDRTAGDKVINNYRDPMRDLEPYKKQGYHEGLYATDSTTDDMLDRRIQEGTSCNFGVKKGNKILLPSTKHGDILDGINSLSAGEIAKFHGYEVVEADVTLRDLLDADEVFVTGTAMSIQAVDQIDRELTDVEGNVTGTEALFKSTNPQKMGPFTELIASEMKLIMRHEHPEQQFNDWMQPIE